MRDAIHSKRNFFESEYRCSEVNYAHFHRFLRFARGGRSNGGAVVTDITGRRHDAKLISRVIASIENISVTIGRDRIVN